MAIDKAIKNARILSNAPFSHRSNEPEQFSNDRMEMYLADDTHYFVKEYGKYASDCVKAMIQLSPELEWESVQLRFSDYVKKSGALTRKFDNYKLAMCIDGKYEYLPLGAKIQTMGNTWVVINPDNMSGADGKALLQRCNATWNFYDFYGNVVKEPICIEKILASATDSNDRGSVIVAKGYFNVKCQYNKNTAQLNTNSRLILGSGAYTITGYSDFEQQFTGDYDSVRLIEFNVRYDEPNEEVDDMDKHIANGKTFSWIAGINGNRIMQVGISEQLTVSTVRNGETIESTEEKPITYVWESSNNEIATVSESGEVTAIAEGTVTIKATLEQNPEIYGEVEIMVETAENKVEFITEIPETLQIHDNVIIGARYYENGTTSNEIKWETSGADIDCYDAGMLKDGSLKVVCWEGSVKPLIVTAKHGEYSVSAEIKLEGL